MAKMSAQIPLTYRTLRTFCAIRSAVAAAETKKPRKRRSAAPQQHTKAADIREVIVSLKEIRDGSLRIVCDGIPKAKTLYKNWVSAIAADDPSRLSPAARASTIFFQKRRGGETGESIFLMATGPTLRFGQTRRCLHHRGFADALRWSLRLFALVGKTSAQLPSDCRTEEN